MSKRVVVGLGNRFRGDDRVGLEVAARLRQRVPAGTEVVAIEGDPTPLLEILEGSELVLVADAVNADSRPGSVQRFDATDEQIPGSVFGASTHAFGLSDTIELARALGKLHARVLVYGITGVDFSAGADMSAAVEAEVQNAVEQILADLAPAGRSALTSHQEEINA
jgi:hydrogenase maturation protease